MSWADAVPNLLIGLREGLEAGLVVTILLAAVRRLPAATAEPDTADPDRPPRRTGTAPIWLGVLAAVTVAGSFAAVLISSTDALSSSAQEAVGGLLSVLAVALVTVMIFWMRRTARSLSAQLRGEVARAAAVGAGALTLTAFLAVGREGLETTLFLWTAAKASGETVAPLTGAAVGLALAVLACWLLYRRAIRINLGTFFGRTGVALVVVAAGVLSYGLGDLQDAGWLPGQRWIAFDLSAHLDPNSWWVSVVGGLTDLAPRMTVLQVTAWIVYLAVVLPCFVAAGRRPVPAPATEPDEPAAPGRWEQAATRRGWPVAATLVAVPAAVAALVIAVLPAQAASATTAVTVTGSGCATQWTSGRTGSQTFAVDNRTSDAGEINLDDASGAVVAEIETLGPATTAQMSATLDTGTYTFVCLMAGHTTRGPSVQVSGADSAGPVLAFTPVTLAELTAPNRAYQAYAADALTDVTHDARVLRADLAAGNLTAARTAWLTAQLAWERVGASYDSFGSEGQAVDGLPDGYPRGVDDPGFTGLHRIEYGLYHGATAAQLMPVADRLITDLGTVVAKLDADDEAGDPTNLPLRVHEIIEDALRDHLSGIDDEGGHAAYAETWADTDVDRVVLAEVAPLVTARDPGLVATIERQEDTLRSALLATRTDGRWLPATRVPLDTRQRVDAAVGALLETLSIEPNLLEVPPTH